MINVFLEEWLGFKLIIYGYHGVILSEILTTFPLAYLILSAALSGLDGTLEDSAQDLGARPLTVLRTVTLPLMLLAYDRLFPPPAAIDRRGGRLALLPFSPSLWPSRRPCS